MPTYTRHQSTDGGRKVAFQQINLFRMKNPFILYKFFGSARGLKGDVALVIYVVGMLVKDGSLSTYLKLSFLS